MKYKLSPKQRDEVNTLIEKSQDDLEGVLFELVGERDVLALENERLREGVACATNALTDSICCSGNDYATNMHFVRKLNAILPNDKQQP